MNIRNWLIVIVLLNPILAFSQRYLGTNLIEIHITKLKEGYWHAQNQSDSVYLNIEKAKCYYTENGSKRIAKMSATLSNVALGQPQTVLEENPITIEFDYLDTLPEPRESNDFVTRFYEEENPPKVFVFKKYTPTQFIIQEKDSLKRIFVFDKLTGNYPQFIQKQVNKLKEIEPKIGGFWVNYQTQQSLCIEEPSFFPEYHLSLELSPLSIYTSKFLTDSLISKKKYTDIEWVNDTEYVFRIELDGRYKRYRIEQLTDSLLILTNDTLKKREVYTKASVIPFPDSILRGLKNRAWCHASFNEYNNVIDTLVFDFGANTDTCSNEGIFLNCEGHGYNEWHSMHSLSFITLFNRCYFIKTTHGSIRLWEITNLTNDSLTLKGFDDHGKLEEVTYFLHPQNKEYFKNGRRLQY